MKQSGNSKNHHWWPVGLQSYWTDKRGDIYWIEPDGSVNRKKASNRKIAYKIHGHTSSRGSVWESNFEAEFDIDNDVHDIISELKKLKPLGYTPREFTAFLKLFFKRDRETKDLCKFYSLEETFHRRLLLLIFSVLIRSPANRNIYERYPEMMGLPQNEEVGKHNMASDYRTAKRLTANGPVSLQFFVVIHSPYRKFIFGDGNLNWLTSSLTAIRINGRALVPLTPSICIYFCSPMSGIHRTKPNCAAITAASWMVDWINDTVQIYSRDKLFYTGKPPKLTEAFRRQEFLQHKERTDGLIEMLDEIFDIYKLKGFPFGSNLYSTPPNN